MTDRTPEYIQRTPSQRTRIHEEQKQEMLARVHWDEIEASLQRHAALLAREALDDDIPNIWDDTGIS